ncbi:MAG: hypothetical protein EAZ97_12490 [Bacteroidetes bacterium]|nr:MAG: hypothetical protein EAZ97_12490 [Bacteroidota bacterium]
MRILNPIYDTVFKYLMEDLEIAKGLISRIIGQQVLELTPAPQEQSSTLLKTKFVQVELQRLDYVAIIKTFDPKKNIILEKVMIEVQKSPFTPEIGRFRKYLAEKYKNISVLQTEDGQEQRYLPMKTIYLIERTFNENLPSILKSNNQYIDVLQKKEYKGAKDKFVNLLTHEAYFIQLGLLPNDLQNSLLRLLSIFTKQFREKDERFVNYPEHDLEKMKDKIVRRMLRRLHGATENDQVKMQMEIEIEYEDFIEKNLADNEKFKAEILLNKKMIKQKDFDLKQKDFELQQSKQKLFETAKELKRLSLPVDQIAKLTGLSIEQIENLN